MHDNVCGCEGVQERQKTVINWCKLIFLLFRRTELLLVAKWACKDTRHDKEPQINGRLEVKAVREWKHSPDTLLPVADWTQPCPHHPGTAIPKICWATWASLWPFCADTNLLKPNLRDVRSTFLPFSAHQESFERANMRPVPAERLCSRTGVTGSRAPSSGLFHPCQLLMPLLGLLHLLDGLGGLRERSKDTSHCHIMRGMRSHVLLAGDSHSFHCKLLKKPWISSSIADWDAGNRQTSVWGSNSPTNPLQSPSPYSAVPPPNPLTNSQSPAEIPFEFVFPISQIQQFKHGCHSSLLPAPRAKAYTHSKVFL